MLIFFTGFLVPTQKFQRLGYKRPWLAAGDEPASVTRFQGGLGV